MIFVRAPSVKKTKQKTPQKQKQKRNKRKQTKKKKEKRKEQKTKNKPKQKQIDGDFWNGTLSMFLVCSDQVSEVSGREKTSTCSLEEKLNINIFSAI